MDIKVQINFYRLSKKYSSCDPVPLNIYTSYSSFAISCYISDNTFVTQTVQQAEKNTIKSRQSVQILLL